MLALMLLAGISSEAAASDAPAKVIFVESDGAAARTIGQEKIETCVRLLAREMGIDQKALPTILVIHVSPREGARAGLKKTAAKLRINSDAEKSSAPYYELWLAGDVSTYTYVYSLHYLLERHFDRHDDEAQQQRSIARVLLYLDATVSAKK